MVPASKRTTQSLLVAFSGVTGIKWVGSFVRKRLIVVPNVVPSYTKLARQLGEQFENFTQFAKGYWRERAQAFLGRPRLTSQNESARGRRPNKQRDQQHRYTMRFSVRLFVWL